jgi:hypothetical protein
MKKIITFIAILLIFLASILIYLYLNYSPKELSQAEKEAAVAKILGRKPQLNDNSPKGDTKYMGKYITFTYPAAAVPKKQLLNGKEVPYTGLEQFIFKMDSPKLTVYLEVINSPSNVSTLTDYPSVKLRQIQSGAYMEEEGLIEDVKGLVFEKAELSSFEKTGFFMSNGKIYSFSVQGPDPKAVREMFNKLTSSSKLL